MPMLRIFVRVFAVAVSAAWTLAPGTSSAGALTCTPTSLSVIPDSLGNLAVACTDAGAPPPVTTTCAITVSPSASLISTTAATVSATLTANTACGTGWSWSATGTGVAFSNSAANPTTLTLPAVATGSTTPVSYAVSLTASASGTQTSASTTITVNPPSAPPPSSSTISCSGYATQVIDIPWGAIGGTTVHGYTKGFTNGMVVVARFTTPAVVGSGVKSKISGAEYPGVTGPISRTASLSLTPCDFSSPNPIGGLWSTVSGSTSPNITYQAGGTSSYYPVLLPSTTYYFNIKNEYNGAPTCPAQFSSCDMRIDLQKPTGW